MEFTREEILQLLLSPGDFNSKFLAVLTERYKANNGVEKLPQAMLDYYTELLMNGAEVILEELVEYLVKEANDFVKPSIFFTADSLRQLANGSNNLEKQMFRAVINRYSTLHDLLDFPAELEEKYQSVVAELVRAFTVNPNYTDFVVDKLNQLIKGE